MAKNIDVVIAFIEGSDNVKTTNLYIEGNQLINYRTPLLERISDGYGGYSFIYNATKYSNSTSKIQHGIRKELAYANADYETVDNVKREAKNLHSHRKIQLMQKTSL